ncbi:MAG: polyprenyl diphosphate synthase [Planctomycetota bacterium]|jgi:undecaprenyl diphosphate synthase
MPSELLQEIQQLSKSDVPRHVAIIMDGNGRWAQERGLPRREGHRAGMKAVREVVEGCIEVGIEVLTLYAFSQENWRRPRHEIAFLMSLLQRYARSEVEDLVANGVEVHVVGEVVRLDAPERKAIDRIIDATRGGKNLQLVLAISYGSRNEIVHAARRLAERVEAGELKPDDIDEAGLAAELYTSPWPDPDLMIRTSGEYRISNFMLWQLAYTELYSTPVLWPDFIWLAAFLAALAALAAWEFGVMYRAHGQPAAPVVAAATSAALVGLAAAFQPGDFVIWAAAGGLLLATILMLRTPPEAGPGLTSVISMFAAAYTGGLLSFAIWLRGTGVGWEGTAVVFLPVAITWLGDTAAYFVGKAVGRHKLAPLISPKKTWEGAVAGFIATTGGAAAYVQLTRPFADWSMSLPVVLGLGAAVAVAGQTGDLFESRFKRDCGVKDSSNIVPGHGGVLDRLDSLLFAFPVAFAYYTAMGL